MPKDADLPSISMANTKKEMLQAYSELKKQLQQLDTSCSTRRRSATSSSASARPRPRRRPSPPTPSTGSPS